MILYVFTLSYSGSLTFVSGEISEFLFFPTRELKKKKTYSIKKKERNKHHKYIYTNKRILLSNKQERIIDTTI